MTRRKLTLDEFFDRITAALRYRAPAPRRRIRGDEGVLMWRRKGLRAGVLVGPSVGGAFVVLGRVSVQIDALPQAIALLEDIFAGEIVEVEATGVRNADLWMARADDPVRYVSMLDRSYSSAEVPVFESMRFRAWPGF